MGSFPGSLVQIVDSAHPVTESDGGFLADEDVGRLRVSSGMSAGGCGAPFLIADAQIQPTKDEQ